MENEFVFETFDHDHIRVHAKIIDVIYTSTDEFNLMLLFKKCNTVFFVPNWTENRDEMLRFIRYQIDHY